MKYFIFSILVIFSGCRLSKETMTIMSWNVQNLFDAVDDGSEYSEFDPGSGEWNERLYRRRLDRIASVIGKVGQGGPDVLILQELEKPRILDDLAGGPLKGRGYLYSLAVDGYSIIRSGVLSRYPLGQVRLVESGFWKGRSLRPILSFSLYLPDETLRVIAVHWKSPRGGKELTETARYREASIVRDVVKDLLRADRSHKIIIIGDLNTSGDGRISPAALAPIGVDEAALYRTAVPDFPQDNNGMIFFDPEPSSGPPGTYYFNKSWARPDRALLSASLLREDGWQFLDCRIADYAELLNSFGEPNRWKTYKEEGYSDHLPLILELFWNTGMD